MKNVIKNIFKSVAVVSLVLQVLVIAYLGVYTVAMNKYIEDNPQEVINRGKDFIESNELENNEEVYRKMGTITVCFSSYIGLRTTGLILIFSLIMGTVIGVVKSIDEKSRKKVIATYFVMYLVLFLIFCLYEIISYGKNIDVTNILGAGFEGFIIYTIIYVVTLLKKKFDNGKKVKEMNKTIENLKEDGSK